MSTDTTGLTARAKIVAQILTDNGHPVDPPDAGTLDDVEWERWNVCLQIVQALSADKMEVCGWCSGTGWMSHPDDPAGKCTRCEGRGGVETQPLSRYQVMDLIEAQIPLWSEDTPPRHALSVLWGKVRDMEAMNNG